MRIIPLALLCTTTYYVRNTISTPFSEAQPYKEYPRKHKCEQNTLHCIYLGMTVYAYGFSHKVELVNLITQAQG